MSDAALIDQLRAQIAELLVIIGASTPIAAFDLATTWRAEKALMGDELKQARDALAGMVVQYMEFREGYVSHEFMSAQEDAIEYLENIGWLTGGKLERYYWTPASGRAAAKIEPPVKQEPRP